MSMMYWTVNPWDRNIEVGPSGTAMVRPLASQMPAAMSWSCAIR